MLNSDKKGKEELFLSVIISLFVVAISLILNHIDIIDESFFIVVIFGILLWPITELVNYKFKLHSLEGIKRNILELKLSVVSWCIFSIFLLITNLLINKEITWSIYPVVGLILWPIYNIFLYITEVYSLKK